MTGARTGGETVPSRLPSREFWAGKRVLLTGHTGFKGGWAALWLERLGARVSAFALPPETSPSLYRLAGVADACDGRYLDLRDATGVARAVEQAQPEIVIHMAAQALVRRSLRDPLETWASNVMGTANLLEAIRACESVRTALIVTTDKVYANTGEQRAMREDDPLGGKDPYSASKAACELLVRSHAQSYAQDGRRIATVRGGNVIGGGDFSEDRLGPDCVRAALAGKPVVLRHPEATRPWQHVLDCLCGYLLYAEHLSNNDDAPVALNIGPAPEPVLPVRDFAEAMLTALDAPCGVEVERIPGSVEAPFLALDPSLAHATLGWRDRLVGADAIAASARWYADWRSGADMAERTRAEIATYETDSASSAQPTILRETA